MTDNRITQLEKTVRIPIPEGRMLTTEEDEKMYFFFKDYTWFSRIYNDRVYFTPFDEDNDDMVELWGYISVESLSKLKLPKKENPKPVKNQVLTSLNWHKKLMNKIK